MPVHCINNTLYCLLSGLDKRSCWLLTPRPGSLPSPLELRGHWKEECNAQGLAMLFFFSWQHSSFSSIFFLYGAIEITDLRGAFIPNCQKHSDDKLLLKHHKIRYSALCRKFHWNQEEISDLQRRDFCQAIPLLSRTQQDSVSWLGDSLLIPI